MARLAVQVVADASGRTTEDDYAAHPGGMPAGHRDAAKTHLASRLARRPPSAFLSVLELASPAAEGWDVQFPSRGGDEGRIDVTKLMQLLQYYLPKLTKFVIVQSSPIHRFRFTFASCEAPLKFAKPPTDVQHLF